MKFRNSLLGIDNVGRNNVVYGRVMRMIKKDNMIEKRNVLNEVRRNSMTLTELRFFTIYLSRINPRDISTRVVKFKLNEFKKIMDIEKMNITSLKNAAVGLLSKTVTVPNERGGFSAFQLFKRATVDQNERGEWYIEFDAHDEALPLMFEFQRDYFTYQLWNALRLRSVNQLRMYEILKQYERIGQRTLEVSELRELLGIRPEEYPRWDNFKERVLDACQRALAESTDITYTYERGRAGRGGKWLSVIFHIQKNDKYIDQLSLAELGLDTAAVLDYGPGLEPRQLSAPAPAVEFDETETAADTETDLIMNETGGRFSWAGVALLVSEAEKRIPGESAEASAERISFILGCVQELDYQKTKRKISDEIQYLRKLVQVKAVSEPQQEAEPLADWSAPERPGSGELRASIGEICADLNPRPDHIDRMINILSGGYDLESPDGARAALETLKAAYSQLDKTTQSPIAILCIAIREMI